MPVRAAQRHLRLPAHDLHRSGPRPTLCGVIDDVDAALVNLLSDGLPKGTQVSVGAPDDDGAARRATLNLFLHDVREDMSRRYTEPEPVRSENGRMAERRVPHRRFHLSYLVTATAADEAAEHRLLSQALGVLAGQEVVPAKHLTGGLAQMKVPVLLSLWPLREGAPVHAAPDIWSALGVALRPSIDLQVTSPLVPAVVEEVGPPVVERVIEVGIPESTVREVLHELPEVVKRRRQVLLEAAGKPESRPRTRRG
jgi:hypothetical protein